MNGYFEETFIYLASYIISNRDFLAPSLYVSVIFFT